MGNDLTVYTTPRQLLPAAQRTEKYTNDGD
jgi:hypothetical protein